jgi:cell pole-organizing protein PopZ
MRRAEELESRVGELEAELQALLDEYVGVQGRIRTLEALAGVEGEAAAQRTLADLPERLRRLAAEDREAAAGDAGVEHDAGDGRTAASQAEVAAAVERVGITDERPDSDSGSEDAADDAAPDDEDDGLDDIIIG